MSIGIEAEGRVEALRTYYNQHPDPLWAARVKREMAIATIEREYDDAVSRLSGCLAPLPRGYIPLLYALSLVFVVAAMLPTRTIRAMHDRL